MTIYDENNVPILFRGPGAALGLSEDVNDDILARHQAAEKAIEEASIAANQALEAAAANPSAETHEALAEARAALAAAHEEHLLTGHAVLIQNTDPQFDDYSAFTVGASNVQQALTEVVGAFDTSHVGEPGQPSDHIFTPGWVASTDPDLARALGNYYSCEVRDIAEVLS